MSTETATAPATAGGLALRSRAGRVALTATIAASAMASLDATIVNVAVPHIAADLDASVSQLQWVLTGYLLALASLILLAGALGDRWGRRRVFQIGTIWFAAASLLCGLAPSIEVLIVARILQGIGGALLTPGSLAIIQAVFREADRSAAVGAWSGLGGVAGAVGPFVGGAVVDGPGWRWAFLLNVPVAGVVVACARLAVPETKDPHATGPLDLPGATLAVLGLATGTWALTAAATLGWSDPTVVLALVASTVTVVLFVRRIRGAAHPLVPPSLFADRTFTVVNVGTAFLYTSVGLTFFLVSYQLQVAAGWTALQAGAAMLPTTGLMLVLSARSGALAHRIGPKAQLTVGPVVAAAGLVLLTRVGTDPRWLTDVLPGALVLGCGLVIFVAPLTATVMAAADPDHVSAASGVNNAVARTAGLVGIAVVPGIAGLITATDAGAVSDAYRTALLVAAAAALVAAPVMLVGLPGRTGSTPTRRRVHCPVDGPPLQPDPRRCPMSSGPT